MLGCYQKGLEELSEGKAAEEVVQSIDEQLLKIKPLKTVREHFTHHYKKLSNLTRKIGGREAKSMVSPRYSRKRMSEGNHNHKPSQHQQSDQRFNDFLKSLLKTQEQRDSLKYLLVEHMLREGQWEQAAVFGDLQTQVDPNGLFKECFSLR